MKTLRLLLGAKDDADVTTAQVVWIVTANVVLSVGIALLLGWLWDGWVSF